MASGAGALALAESGTLVGDCIGPVPGRSRGPDGEARPFETGLGPWGQAPPKTSPKFGKRPRPVPSGLGVALQAGPGYPPPL